MMPRITRHISLSKVRLLCLQTHFIKPGCWRNLISISSLATILNGLLNVIYKVCSKILTNRLKIILLDIISHSQSAFILGRLISDNCLVTSKTSHFMLRKNNGWNGVMALKLDVSKAYNRIECSFLEQMMKRLGFSRNLTNMDAKVLVACLGMERVEYHDHYLGLPVFVGRSKKATFVYIKDHLSKKLNGWCGTLLSQ